ncbi:MAG TPA: phage protein GemA/Gp16 family protein [Pyrinomonadaceae bacterium]|jgi:hypothetical protein
MQLVSQNEFRTGSGSDPVKRATKRSKKSARAGTIASIHITWAKIRRDLKGDKDELRESRLVFMSRVLNREVKSSRDLSQAKLGKVLDAMRELERSPTLPGGVPTVDRGPSTDEAGGPPSPVDGQVLHLATASQVATIDKLFAHLGWSPSAIEGFVDKRFKRKSHHMITPQQANKLTMILFTIAASRDIKRRWKAETGNDVEHVSREMIKAEIPALKQRLGIDQRPEVGGQRSDDEEHFDEQD